MKFVESEGRDKNAQGIQLLKLMLISSLVLILYLPATSASEYVNISITFTSATNNAVANVTVDLVNETGAIGQMNSTSDGVVWFQNISGTSFNATTTYPSSGYSAVISDGFCDPIVMINDFGSLSLTLKNTLGEFLEAQDGNVFITELTNNKVIKNYDTLCKAGEPQVDDDGNWFTYSNCPITDSRGGYHYRFDVKEGDGFYYNETYTVHVILNAKEYVCNFTTDLPRPPDTDKYKDMAQRYSGYLFIGIVLTIMVILVIILLRRLWQK